MFGGEMGETLPQMTDRFLCDSISQAQRDYFGAHTYELLSNPGHFVHTNWTGHGGSVSSTTYQA